MREGEERDRGVPSNKELIICSRACSDISVQHGCAVAYVSTHLITLIMPMRLSTTRNTHALRPMRCALRPMRCAALRLVRRMTFYLVNLLKKKEIHYEQIQNIYYITSHSCTMS